MTKVTVTRERLVELDACDEGIAAFDAAYPDGTAEYDPHSHEDAERILGGPLGSWWSWWVGEGGAPFVLAAGHGGTSTSGDSGTATAGDYGTATAGDYGTATAGDYGTATAGRCGTATAGYRGTATAGDYGTATAGRCGTATAGRGGSLHIVWWDGERRRLATAYVGEDGIKADTPYRVEVVDGRPVFVEVTR